MKTSQCIQVLTHHLPEIASNPIVPITEGWDFYVLDIDDRWIFRFPRRREGLQQLEREIRFLDRIKEDLPVSIPHYQWNFPDAELPFAGYPKLQGEALTPRHGLKYPSVMEQIGSFLAVLHQYPISVQPNALRQTWKKQMENLWIQVENKVLPQMEPSLAQQIQSYWTQYAQQLLHFQPAWLHGDLSLNHILTARPDLTGIIDWGDVQIGDPALDFAGIASVWDKKQLQPLLQTYSIFREENWWERITFYRRLSPFYGLLSALETHDRDRWKRSWNNLMKEWEGWFS